MIFDTPEKISRKALNTVCDEKSILFLSSASTWEIAIKYSIGKLKLTGKPNEWIPRVALKMGLRPMPISQNHAISIINLPNHHKDPFDRIIISQSIIENFPVITPDKIFKKYKSKVLW